MKTGCEILAAEVVLLLAERDEARRRYVRCWTAEHGSMTMDLLVCAWGRQAALDLYPDHDLKSIIAESLGCLPLGDDGCARDPIDEEEIQDRIAANHRRLNAVFPETK